MDPITHTVLGAAAAHVFTSKQLGRGALLLGAAGGLLPDIDVLWGSIVSDPALPWEYHRHFTHALPFIPVGAAVAAAPFLVFRRFREKAGWAYLAALIGMSTHGFNDTLTSFGTFLYWPFSSERIAWDVISIIDPVFTVPLILGIVLALIVSRAWPTRIAFAIALMYLTLGFVQNQRVLAAQERLAAARGHVIERGRAMPTMANILIWRSLYESDGVLYADSVRAALFGPILVREGGSINRFTIDDLPQREINQQRVREVFAKFSDFADDYTAVAAMEDGFFVIGDMRYSLDAAAFSPLWGIRIQHEGAGAIDPVEWINLGAESPDHRRDALRRLWDELVRPGPEYAPLDR